MVPGLPYGPIGEMTTMDDVYFLGWGTLSLINAGLAQGKNRSGLAWFLISLILGPLATFLIVVLPMRASKQREG